MKNFLEIDPSHWICESKHFFGILDGFPVSPGHFLIVSKALKVTFFDLSREEKDELFQLVETIKRMIDEVLAPDGYNIGMNCGEAAGQTVMHFHCHVIPRYVGDMEDPRGGVRHCIPMKGYY